MNTAPRAIHHLSCGTMCPRGARVLTGAGGMLAEAHMVCHCLLIEGADGLVLVDTGFGLQNIRDPRQLGRAFSSVVRPRLDVAEAAISQVRALGFDPHDVRHIITTHLDLDHAGGLPDFPEAEVHLLGLELQAALAPGWRDRTRYLAVDWAHGPRWVEHGKGGERWHGFDGVRILPDSDAEILLIPLLGHTRGHTGVAIREGEGWLLHCGDAYFHHGEVSTPPSYPWGVGVYAAFMQADGRARLGNLERLRELAERRGQEVELICSHDAAYLQAPAVGSSLSVG